jgi:hypothetical protein
MYWNEKDHPVAHFHAYHAGRRAILWWQQPKAVWLDLRLHRRAESGQLISREVDQPEPGLCGGRGVSRCSSPSKIGLWHEMNLRQKRQNVLFQQAWNTQRSGFHNAAKLFGSSKDDPGLDLCKRHLAKPGAPSPRCAQRLSSFRFQADACPGNLPRRSAGATSATSMPGSSLLST